MTSHDLIRALVILVVLVIILGPAVRGMGWLKRNRFRL